MSLVVKKIIETNCESEKFRENNKSDISFVTNVTSNRNITYGEETTTDITAPEISEIFKT